MNAELQELCEFFQRLNHREKKNAGEENVSISEDSVSLQDVNVFNDFVINNGGHTGGWDTTDHNMFVKLSRKHNLRSVIYLLRLSFPDINEERIIAHDKWYRKYLKLKDNQQKALRFWRLKKTAEQNADKDLQSVTSIKIVPKNDEDIKDKIEKWREYKNKIKEEEEKAFQQQAEKQMKTEKMKQLVQQNKKKMILQHKLEKEQEYNALKTARTIEEKEKQKLVAKRANRMLLLYRKKDVKILQKIQTKKMSALQKQHEKQHLLHKLAWKYRKNINVDRDPIRLFIPTVEWKQKMKKNDDAAYESVIAKPISIANIQHLATPQWRKTQN